VQKEFCTKLLFVPVSDDQEVCFDYTVGYFPVCYVNTSY
jgi:hypothetical protein